MRDCKIKLALVANLKVICEFISILITHLFCRLQAARLLRPTDQALYNLALPQHWKQATNSLKHLDLNLRRRQLLPTVALWRHGRTSRRLKATQI
jgi:hypothetical protein